jgi:lipopolysaccharide cholinephosphotransferase
MELKNLNLDEFSLDEEIRNDYLVSKSTKKIWAVQLDLLMELLRVCNKNDIPVYAFAGTLLGTIRHKGFIPWDDDIDVCLLREDFERLIQISEYEFQEPYFLQYALNDRKYFCGYARLRNSETTGIITGQCSCNYNNGIYIDVFVLDGFVENTYKLKIQLLQKYILSLAILLYNKQYSKNKVMSNIQAIFRKVFKYEYLVGAYNKVLTRYNKKTDRVSLMTHNSYFRNRYWCNKKDLAVVEMLPYECSKIPVPSEYDRMLKNMYGNYMEFPPVEKRGTWHDNQLLFDPDTPYKVFIKEKE